MKCLMCHQKQATMYSRYTNGKFCSRVCARAYSTKQKRKYINRIVSKKLEGRRVGGYKTISDQCLKKKLKNIYKKLMLLPFQNCGKNQQRRRVQVQQDNRCNVCKINDYMGKHIVLQLHHKDGNHCNNVRQNLQILCPNCHSQTHNFNFKNSKYHKSNLDKIHDKKKSQIKK